MEPKTVLQIKEASLAEFFGKYKTEPSIFKATVKRPMSDILEWHRALKGITYIDDLMERATPDRLPNTMLLKKEAFDDNILHVEIERVDIASKSNEPLLVTYYYDVIPFDDLNRELKLQSVGVLHIPNPDTNPLN